MTSEPARKTRKSTRTGVLTALFVALVVVALPLPTAAQAEEEAEPKTAAERADEEGLEVLFITAEKTLKDKQKTGGSVAVFTESMLEDRGITDVKGITDYVPNVKIHTNTNGNTGFAVNIRGAIKGDPIISREPVVGLYVDDVYLSNMVGNLFDVLELESIEVLRGPQGTLYGRNTNGGAIKLTTKAPTDELTVRNDFTFGNYDTLNNRTIFNVPLLGDSEYSFLGDWGLGTINTRTAFATLNRDGFIDVIAPVPTSGPAGSRELDDIDRWMVHHRTRWQPTEATTVDYIYDRVKGDEKPTASQLSTVTGGLTPAILTPFIRNKRVDSVSHGQGANGLSLANDIDVWGHTLTAAHEMPTLPVLGDVTVKSITAYREKTSHAANDIDGTGFRVFETSLDIKHKQFSQEIQINGVTHADRIDYVAGFYYFDESGSAVNNQDFFMDPFYGGFFFPSMMVDFVMKSEKTSYAGYAQANYTPPVLEDKLTFTGGVRYTDESSELDVSNVNSLAGVLIDTGIGGAANVSKPKGSFDDWSWLARIQYQFTEDVMAYYKVNTGFLAGGFNARNTNHPLSPAVLAGATPFGTAFNPEKLTSHEVGIRSDLLERRLRLNLTGFYYDYEDIQIAVFSPGTGGATTQVSNAGEARIWGIELEMNAMPFEGAQVDLSYGYLNPEYEKFADPFLGDVSKTRGFAQTPDHTVTVGASYELPAFSWGTVMARMDWAWSDEVIFSDTPNAAIDQTSSFWTLNGMVQVADIELPNDYGTLRTQFWMKNITDEQFKEFGFSLENFFPPPPALIQEGFAVNTYNDPRTYGLTVVYEWED